MSLWLSQFLESLLFLSPYILVDLVAVILALIWWRRHPTVSLLTLLAIGFGFLISLGGNFLLAWLPYFFFPEPTEPHDWDSQNWQSQFEKRMLLTSVLGMIRNALGAVAYALLVVAVFIGRSRTIGAQGPPTVTAAPGNNESPAGAS